jgi:hypothetical protein
LAKDWKVGVQLLGSPLEIYSFHQHMQNGSRIRFASYPVNTATVFFRLNFSYEIEQSLPSETQCAAHLTTFCLIISEHSVFIKPGPISEDAYSHCAL